MHVHTRMRVGTHARTYARTHARTHTKLTKQKKKEKVGTINDVMTTTLALMTLASAILFSLFPYPLHRRLLLHLDRLSIVHRRDTDTRLLLHLDRLYIVVVTDTRLLLHLDSLYTSSP